MDAECRSVFHANMSVAAGMATNDRFFVFHTCILFCCGDRHAYLHRQELAAISRTCGRHRGPDPRSYRLFDRRQHPCPERIPVWLDRDRRSTVGNVASVDHRLHVAAASRPATGLDRLPPVLRSVRVTDRSVDASLRKMCRLIWRQIFSHAEAQRGGAGPLIDLNNLPNSVFQDALGVPLARPAVGLAKG